jgi:hypothetical protein
MSLDNLPDGVLTEAQIRKLFSNKTVKGIHNSSGSKFKRYFGENGYLAESRSGKEKRTGHWSASNEGLCLSWEDGQEKCRELIKEGGVVKQYKSDESGEKKLTVTYQKFKDGEHGFSK